VKIKQVVLLLSFLTYSGAIKAQDLRYIDSLTKKIARQSVQDTTTVEMMNELAFEISYLNLDSGLAVAQRGLTLAKKLNFKHGIASAWNIMGTVYYDKADYKNSIECYTEARRILEQYNNPGLLIALYANLANTHMALEDFDNARHYMYDAKKLLEGKKAKQEAFYAIYATLGEIYYQEGRFDSALYYCDLTLPIETDDRGYVSATYSSKGYCHLNLKQYDLAERSFLEGIKIAEEIKSDYYYYGNLYGLGELYLKTGRTKESETALLRALDYFHRYALINMEMNVSESLYRLYNTGKRYDKALFYHVKYAAIRDSINSAETNKIARELEKKYENEKKKAQIEKLNLEKNASEAENERKGQLLLFAIIGCILVIIALGFAVYAFINKRKANVELQALHQEVSEQKNELFDKNKNITDSILYAQRIQKALLTSHSYIKESVEEFFILNKPKDIVSGDFYWAQKKGNDLYFMLADCTGHGVPGAFMSLLGISFMNELVVGKGLKETHTVLNELRSEIIMALTDKDDKDYEMKDGMDAVLCRFNFSKLHLEYTAANNAIVVVRNGIFMDLKGDKMPVGRSPKDNTPFSKHEFTLQKNDMVYMFSDGFPDQFGGPRGKKLKEKNLKAFLVQIASLSMEEQEKKLSNYFTEWKGDLEQIDDVCLAGFRI
jgi:serine phosphatase RsbU (regulator of sigma subunit)/tetratricopeptide (TPR) repeat protein